MEREHRRPHTSNQTPSCRGNRPWRQQPERGEPAVYRAHVRGSAMPRRPSPPISFLPEPAPLRPAPARGCGAFQISAAHRFGTKEVPAPSRIITIKGNKAAARCSSPAASFRGAAASHSPDPSPAPGSPTATPHPPTLFGGCHLLGRGHSPPSLPPPTPPPPLHPVTPKLPAHLRGAASRRQPPSSRLREGAGKRARPRGVPGWGGAGSRALALPAGGAGRGRLPGHVPEWCRPCPAHGGLLLLLPPSFFPFVPERPS